RRGLRSAEPRGLGSRSLRDGGNPRARLRCADPVDDPRQALGPSRRRGGGGPGAGAREVRLGRGSGAGGPSRPRPAGRHDGPGRAKGIGPSSRIESRDALVREVARVVHTYGQPALVEAFLEGPEYTVTLVGHAPPRALPTLQRALEVSTGIGAHAVERHPPPP